MIAPGSIGYHEIAHFSGLGELFVNDFPKYGVQTSMILAFIIIAVPRIV
jgi:hypothetical protein